MESGLIGTAASAVPHHRMSYSPDQLSAYQARIGVAGALRPDRATLALLQRAHRLAIPFENLDIRLGRGIALDRDRLFAKLVANRRGGYCFEQNALFLGMLEAIGFAARPLLARVWLVATDTPPRTHTLNLISLGEEQIVADVGFGGSFVPPLPLAAGDEVTTADGARHRLVEDPEHGWMLERDGGDGWARQYSFTLDRVWPADLEAANHFTATCPGTRFTTLRIASAPTANGHASLIGTTLTVSTRGRAEVQEVTDAGEYRRVLAERFGLDFGEDEIEALGLY